MRDLSHQTDSESQLLYYLINSPFNIPKYAFIFDLYFKLRNTLMNDDRDDAEETNLGGRALTDNPGDLRRAFGPRARMRRRSVTSKLAFRK